MRGMMRTNHNAYFDILAISSRLQELLGDIAFAEIHLFAYLACLLSLYKKIPASKWGYVFAVTEYGYPYSADLYDAVETMKRRGYLVDAEKLAPEYLKITEDGKNEYAMLRDLSQMAAREPFIDGACSSLLALPVGTIRTALSQDINIKNALVLGKKRLLLTRAEQEILYEQFASLSTAIGADIDDLMVPSVVWLTYLAELRNA